MCRRQNKFNLKTKFLLGMGKKHCGKRRKFWLPAFSSFSTMLSDGFFFRVIKSWDCVVKGYLSYSSWSTHILIMKKTQKPEIVTFNFSLIALNSFNRLNIHSPSSPFRHCSVKTIFVRKQFFWGEERKLNFAIYSFKNYTYISKQIYWKSMKSPQ